MLMPSGCLKITMIQMPDEVSEIGSNELTDTSSYLCTKVVVRIPQETIVADSIEIHQYYFT